MNNRPWVVKIGGRLCDDAAIRDTFAAACATLNQPLVIVHGGGAQVTELQKALGYDPTFFEGRRVTSLREMSAVEMVLSGAVNKALVRSLLMQQRKAVGISGSDAAMVVCSVVAELGCVGVPERVDPLLIKSLIHSGYVPVVSPVSVGPRLEPLNVNADELACGIAMALQAERLLLLSDVDGVRGADAQTASRLGESEVEALIASGVASGGMIPKLRSAALAVRGGVDEVRIGGFNVNGGSLAAIAGTCVYRDRA